MTQTFEIAATLADSVLAIWFVRRFCNIEDKLRHRIFAVLLLLVVTVFSNEHFSQFSVVTTFVLAFITLLYTAVSTYKIDFRQIFATFIFWIALAMISSLLFIIFSIITDDFATLMMGSYSLARYLYVILHKVILFTVLRIVIAFVSIEGKVGRLNSILTFSVSAVSILGLGATMYIATTDYASQMENQIIILIISFLFTNVIIYSMLAQIERLRKKEYELKLLEEKTAFDSARHEETTSVWQNVRRIQHDMKQHFSVINAQLEEGKTDEIREYLAKLLPEIESMGRVVRSENKTIDYIINSKLSSLTDTQIVISGLIADFSDIEDRDLACLFGNILDNAVEAISELEEKRLEILFSIENASRMIIFKNTVGRPVLKSNPDLKSTKNDGTSHGYGHKIVEKIVKDHSGMIDYFEEGDMFGVQIIFPGISKKQA